MPRSIRCQAEKPDWLAKPNPFNTTGSSGTDGMLDGFDCASKRRRSRPFARPPHIGEMEWVAARLNQKMLDTRAPCHCSKSGDLILFVPTRPGSSTLATTGAWLPLKIGEETNAPLPFLRIIRPAKHSQDREHAAGEC